MTLYSPQEDNPDEVSGHQWTSHKLRRMRYWNSPSFSFEWKGWDTKKRRKFDDGDMSKDDLLYYLRDVRERVHRDIIQQGFDRYALCWTTKPSHRPTQDVDSTARIQIAGNIQERTCWIRDFFETSNKSVPFYVLPTPEVHFGRVPAYLRNVLAGYLYERWFRPYQSDVDFNQFIAKLIVPMDLELPDSLERPSAELIDELSKATRSIVTYMTAAKSHLIARTEKRIAESRVSPPGSISHHCCANDNSDGLGCDYDWQCRPIFVSPQQLMEHYTIPPLFRSIGIIFRVGDWDRLKDPSKFGEHSVYMFLTGAENPGLSAPITFDSIESKIQAVLQNGPRKAVQVTLDTAITFIMDLERREALASSAASSGPDAKTSFPKPKYPKAYDHFFQGVSQWGPSSGWVDAAAREWSGLGARLDIWHYFEEQKQYNFFRFPGKYQT